MINSHKGLNILSKVFPGLALFIPIPALYNLYLDIRNWGWYMFYLKYHVLDYQIIVFALSTFLITVLLMISFEIRKFLAIADDIAIIKDKLLE